jgi:hypothetical protein
MQASVIFRLIFRRRTKKCRCPRCPCFVDSIDILKVSQLVSSKLILSIEVAVSGRLLGSTEERVVASHVQQT